jgi:hypothetical protein
VHGLNSSANPHILIAIAAQISDLRAVVAEADDGEAAVVVRCGWSANVKEARAVGQLHHFVNVGGETDVLVELLGGEVRGDAGAGCGDCGGRHRAGEQRDQNCSEHERRSLSGEGSW